jgi:hypothetical protein
VASGCGLLDRTDDAAPADRLGILDGPVEAAFADYESCKQRLSDKALLWLDPAVTDDQVEAVSEALAASPSVESYRYVDSEETYNNFQEYWADDPSVLDLVRPGEVPTSFELDLVGLGVDFEAEDGPDLVAMPGVDELDVASPTEHATRCETELQEVNRRCEAPEIKALPTVVYAATEAGVPTVSETDITAALGGRDIVWELDYLAPTEVLTVVTDLAAAADITVDTNIASQPDLRQAAYLVVIDPGATPQTVDRAAADLKTVDGLSTTGRAWTSTGDICAVAAYLLCTAEPAINSATKIVVWLDTSVGPDRVEAVAALLGRSELVAGYRYIDSDETYQRFTEFFSDEHEILDQVAPSDIPTSFEVDLTTDGGATDPADVLALQDDLEGVESVDEVEVIGCSEAREATLQQCGAFFPLDLPGIRIDELRELCQSPVLGLGDWN